MMASIVPPAATMAIVPRAEKNTNEPPAIKLTEMMDVTGDGFRVPVSGTNTTQRKAQAKKWAKGKEIALKGLLKAQREVLKYLVENKKGSIDMNSEQVLVYARHMMRSCMQDLAEGKVRATVTTPKKAPSSPAEPEGEEKEAQQEPTDADEMETEEENLFTLCKPVDAEVLHAPPPCDAASLWENVMVILKNHGKGVVQVVTETPEGDVVFDVVLLGKDEEVRVPQGEVRRVTPEVGNKVRVTSHKGHDHRDTVAKEGTCLGYKMARKKFDESVMMVIMDEFDDTIREFPVAALSVLETPVGRDD